MSEVVRKTALTGEMRWWAFGYGALFALCLVGYPFLAAVLTALDAYATAASIALRAVVLGLSLLALAVAAFHPGQWPRVALVCLLFWVALLVRFLWDATLRLPMDLPWDEYVLSAIGITFVPAFALAAAPAADVFDGARRVIQLLATGAAVALGIAVVRLVNDLSLLARLEFDAINPITIGHLGVTLMVVACARPAVRGRYLRIMDARVVRWTGAFLGFVLMIVSGSRGPVVAGVAILVVAQIARFVKGESKAYLAIGSTLAGVLAAGLIALQFADRLTGIPLVERFLTVGQDQSSSVRLVQLESALVQFERAPLAGSAFVEFEQRFYPHNIAAETLMTTGIIGAVLLTVVLILSVRSAWRIMRTPYSWVVLLYVQSAIAALTSGSLYFDNFFWAMTLTLGALERVCARSAREPDTQLRQSLGPLAYG